MPLHHPDFEGRFDWLTAENADQAVATVLQDIHFGQRVEPLCPAVVYREMLTVVGLDHFAVGRERLPRQWQNGD